MPKMFKRHKAIVHGHCHVTCFIKLCLWVLCLVLHPFDKSLSSGIICLTLHATHKLCKHWVVHNHNRVLIRVHFGAIILHLIFSPFSMYSSSRGIMIQLLCSWYIDIDLLEVLTFRCTYLPFWLYCSFFLWQHMFCHANKSTVNWNWIEWVNSHRDFCRSAFTNGRRWSYERADIQAGFSWSWEIV